MSLYNDASLAMIPSAVKDGKLYSIRPTDGSGDFTFSRGSNLAATRVDVNGLIEKGRENLLLQSNQFDTTWTISGATLTSGQSGYDGSSDAWLLTKTSANGRPIQNVSSSGVQSFSIYAKANASNWIKLQIWDGSVFKAVSFNLSDGSIGSLINLIDANIESVGNDWYRCSIIFTASTQIVYVYPAEGDNVTSGTSGSIYIQDAQLEVGLVATDYIETTTTTAVSGITEDLPRLDYSGSCPSLLLEPTRTNLITNSEYFGSSYWVKNNSSISIGFLSPDGLTNASKLIASVDNTIHNIRTSSIATPAVGTTVTYSIYIKPQEITKIALVDNWTNLSYGVVDLTNKSIIEQSLGTTSIGEDLNGFIRVSFTYQTANINTLPSVWLLDSGYTSGNPTSYTFTSDGNSGVIIYGAQLEEASYPSSYIPTYGSAVTRSFDNCDLLNLVSQGIITDSTEWTIMFDVDGLSTEYNTADGQWFQGNGTLDVYMRPNTINSDFARFYWRKDSKYIGNNFGKKIIARLSGGVGTTFVDGVLDGFSSITGDYSNIAFDKTTNLVAAGYIKQILVFPTALTDSECIALTTL